MDVRGSLACLLTLLLVQLPLVSQQPPPPPKVVMPGGFGPRIEAGPQQQPPPPIQEPAEAPKPVAPAPAQAQAPKPLEAAAPGDAGSFGGLNLQGVNLAEVVDFLARRLKINYIMDPRVRGAVTINTYGETKDIDTRALLDLILRINGAAMVQAGSVFRIVPLAELAKMPLSPQVDQNKIPEDDRAMLNLIFLKYANVEDLSKLIDQFLGPEGKIWAYPPANLLLVLDSRRNMNRTMEMISLFDSDTLAKQRVRLFDIKNSKPSDISKELEGLFKSISLSKDLTSVKFVPVDRINTLIAVAPNPGVFARVEEWLQKLDVKVKGASGKVDTYIYRVKYGRSELLAMAIMSLYMSFSPWGGGYGMGGMYGGMGGMGMAGMYGGMGGMGMGGMYGGMGGMGMGGMGMGGMGMGGMFGGGGGMYGGGAQGFSPAASAAMMQNANVAAGGVAGGGGAGGVSNPANVTSPFGGDQTGAYLSGGMGGYGMSAHPRIVPNPLDNTLLILATPEEYEGINKLLREIDIAPRQVLIEAKIYEVSLTGAFAYGVDSYLRKRGTTGGGDSTPSPGPAAALQAVASSAGGLGALSVGALVGQSRELLAVLTAEETQGKTRVISSPSIIATDSVPASLNVGVEVPTLSSQAVTGGISEGSSLFANTITNRSTGVTLNVTARVTPSGVVTLIINQNVSAPQPPATGGIQSPSFSNRTLSTQITLGDGDTIAIGGIIADQGAESSSGIPFLHRLPIAGALFGQKSGNRTRTELVIFMTPRVIYDTNELSDASDELRGKFKRLQRLLREE